MVTIRCFPGDVLTLTIKNKGIVNPSNEQSGGVYPDYFPSTTKPVWTLDDHTLAEFFEQSPDGHSIKVKAIAIGAPVATATIDTGFEEFTLDIVAPPIQTLTPHGDYERNPPERTTPP